MPVSIVVSDLSTAGPEVVSPLHALLADLVAGGAAIGWVEPPERDEISALLADLVRAARAGDAAVRGAFADGRLVGFGYWQRYARPTHRHNADVQKVAVAAAMQGRGAGRALTEALIGAARAARIEVLTLDVRADNAGALALYRSLGFREYGRLAGFVAVGERRYDKVFLAMDLRPSDRG